MNLRRFLPRMALAALGLTTLASAHADTFSTNGTFAADNSSFVYKFATSSTENFTISTSSYAAGGFDPVLTLFSMTTGKPVDNSGTGVSDAMLTDTLGADMYALYLTEFPNVANGNLSDGFLFAGNPTITGDSCGVAGGMFYDTVTCTQRSANYALSVTSAATPVAATPEPSSWLLVLPGMAAIAYSSRRRQIA